MIDIKAREPRDQYQSEEKQAYREKVWITFADNLPDKENAKILFFPGRHGLEIEVALKNGFREENLIACEENAAILATAVWRKKYPKIRCYGNKLQRTIERLKEDKIVLDAANFDYCSNLCTAVFDDFSKLRNTDIINPRLFVLSVTLFKGRESRALVDIARLVFREPHGKASCLLRNNKAIDRIRILWAFLEHELGMSCYLLYQSEYQSATKRMCFGIFTVKSLKEILSKAWATFYEDIDTKILKEISLLEDVIQNSQDGQHPMDDKRWDEADEIDTEIREAELKIKRELALKYNLKVTQIPRTLSENRSRLYELRNEIWDRGMNYYRKSLIRSESEKAQILQDRGSWR